MEQDWSIKSTELEQRLVAALCRIDSLERGQEALNRLATAVEVLASKQDGMGKNLGRLTEKMETLEQRPARRWESLVDKVLLVLAGMFVTFLLTQGGA